MAEIRGTSVLRVAVANESDAPVLDVVVLARLAPPDDPDAPPVGLAPAKQVRRIPGRDVHDLFVTVAAEHRLRRPTPFWWTSPSPTTTAIAGIGSSGQPEPVG